MKNLLVAFVLVLFTIAGFAQKGHANKRKAKLKAAFARQATIAHNKQKAASLK